MTRMSFLASPLVPLPLSLPGHPLLPIIPDFLTNRHLFHVLATTQSCDTALPPRQK
jgi:hypothetical protein